MTGRTRYPEISVANDPLTLQNATENRRPQESKVQSIIQAVSTRWRAAFKRGNACAFLSI